MIVVKLLVLSSWVDQTYVSVENFISYCDSLHNPLHYIHTLYHYGSYHAGPLLYN